MNDTTLSIRDVTDEMAMVHETATISPHAVVGAPAEWHGQATKFPVVVEPEAIIREGATVHAGCKRTTVVGKGTLLMAQTHVGHDAQIGEGCDIAPHATLGGCVTVGNNVKIGMNAVLVPWVTVGDGAQIGAGAVVTKDVPAGEVWVGNPAKKLRDR